MDSFSRDKKYITWGFRGFKKLKMYSVVIPSIGRVNYLNELIKSIYNQTLSAEEIIIIFDNNEKCKEIEKLIPKR